MINRKKARHITITVLLIMVQSFASFASFDVKTAGVFLLIVYGYAIYAWVNTTQRVMSLYLAFLAYCMVSNAGQTILNVFDVNYTGVVQIYKTYRELDLLKTLQFEARCILMLSLGALIAYSPKAQRARLYEYNTTRIENGDVFFMFLYVVMVVQYVIKLGSRSNLTYTEFFYTDGVSTNVDIRIAILFYAFLYRTYWHHINDKYTKPIYVACLILGAMMMAVGSRSLVIPIVLGLAFIRRMSISGSKRIKASKILYYAFVGVVLLYFLQVIKQLRAYGLGALSFSALANALSKSLIEGVIAILDEMGASTRCIVVTIREIDSHTVSNEATMLYSLLKAFIPVNILTMLGLEPVTESLTVWVTTVGGGWAGTGAWGYSIIAEAYYNLAQNGCILLFVFGYLWVMLERFAEKLVRKEYYIAGFAIIYFLAYAVFLARAELALLTSTGRYCFYILLISYVYRHAFSRRGLLHK